MRYTRTGLGFVCPSPLVWSTAHSRCMNADDPRLMGARPVVGQPDPRAAMATPDELIANAANQGVQFAQQTLSDEARSYLAARGVSAHCKIDDNWFAGPQGGEPSMLCSLNGGPYEHGAYALNANPSLAVAESMRGPVATAPAPAPTPTPNYPEIPPGPAPRAPNYPDSSIPPGPAPTAPSPAAPAAAQQQTPAAASSPYTPVTLPALPELPAVLTESWVGGVPNWALAAVAGFALYKSLD